MFLLCIDLRLHTEEALREASKAARSGLHGLRHSRIIFIAVRSLLAIEPYSVHESMKASVIPLSSVLSKSVQVLLVYGSFKSADTGLDPEVMFGIHASQNGQPVYIACSRLHTVPWIEKE